MNYFMLLFVLLLNLAYAEKIKAPRPTGMPTALCAGCADDWCCNLVLADLAFIESQLQELAQCACCQYEITQADIDTGNYTITEPGIYCLVEDVTFSGSGNAITINNTQPKVFLNLGGHTITGDGSGTGVSITNTEYGTVVYNGVITECQTGIYLLDATQVEILELEIFACREYGIYATSAFIGGGITIKNCFIKDIFGGAVQEGISLFGCGVMRVFDTKLENTQGTSVHIEGCFETTCKGVSVYDSGEFGYLISTRTSPTNVVTFENCISSNAQNSGFVVISNIVDGANSIRHVHCASIQSGANGFDLVSDGGTIQSIEYIDCQAVGNHGNGFSSDSAGVASNIRVVIYENCTAHLNNANSGIGLNGDGFYVDGQSFLVKSCYASENEGSGYNLSLNAFGAELLGNSAYSNVVYGIQDQGSSNLIYSNIASDNIFSNYSAAVPLQLIPTDITGYWINVDKTATTIGEYESKINVILDFQQTCCDITMSEFDVTTSYIDAITTFQQTCCSSVTSELEIIMSDLDLLTSLDLSCCVSTMSSIDIITSSLAQLQPCPVTIIDQVPFFITSPGAYMLCSDLFYGGGAGYAIQIDNSLAGDVILDLNGHSIIGVGTDLGVNVLGSTGVAVIKNGYIANFETGIQVVDGHTVIEDMRIEDVLLYGIDAESVESVTVKHTNIGVRESVSPIIFAYGLHFSRANEITVKDVQISGGSNGIGLDNIFSAWFENLFIDNISTEGIYIATEIRNVTFFNCTLSRCLIAIYIEQLASGAPISGLSFINVSIVDSLHRALFLSALDDAVSGILFKDCVMNVTADSACELYGGIGHIFDGCSILSSRGFGIYIQSKQVEIVNSIFSNHASHGIIINTDDVSVKNSIISYNELFGIQIKSSFGSNNAQILACDIFGNRSYGISADSTNIYIEKCTIVANDDGVHLSSSASGSQVLNNYVANNASTGIFCDDASAYIWGNTAHRNSTNYGGGFPAAGPIILNAITPTAPYWANVE